MSNKLLKLALKMSWSSLSSPDTNLYGKSDKLEFGISPETLCFHWCNLFGNSRECLETPCMPWMHNLLFKWRCIGKDSTLRAHFSMTTTTTTGYRDKRKRESNQSFCGLFAGGGEALSLDLSFRFCDLPLTRARMSTSSSLSLSMPLPSCISKSGSDSSSCSSGAFAAATID
jgi:hypothetical protein